MCVVDAAETASYGRQRSGEEDTEWCWSGNSSGPSGMRRSDGSWSECALPMLNAIRITGASGPRPVETRAACTLGPVIARSLRASESEASEPEAAAQVQPHMRL